MKTLIYDGTFDGLITAVFEVFEYKIADSEIISEEIFSTENLFAEKHHVITDSEKSSRVLKKMQQLGGNDSLRTLFKLFLSEHLQKERLILKAVAEVIQKPGVNVFQNLADEDMLEISEILKSMGREIHRMHAFVRFEKLQDEMYFARIEPDYNVLPLLLKHFTDRYADQKWMIFDLKRGYGALYDLKNAELFYPQSSQIENFRNAKNLHHVEEKHFQKMWQNYFVKTGIPTRKNMKLHIQYVPKRYWKYLTEKK